RRCRGRGDRDRDRPGPVGGRAGRRRVPGARDQPPAGVPVQGAVLHLGSQKRRGGRAGAGLAAADTLELLVMAPDPARAARLSLARITAALKRARRRDTAGKAAMIAGALRAAQLTQPPAVTAAYAATVQATARVIVALNEQVKELEVQVHAHFGAHPDAEIYLSQPGIGTVTGARV